MRYGKLVDGKLVPIPATVVDPKGVWRVARTLTVAEAAEIGYKPVVYRPMVEAWPDRLAEDEYAVPVGWEEDEREIRRVWRIEKLKREGE